MPGAEVLTIRRNIYQGAIDPTLPADDPKRREYTHVATQLADDQLPSDTLIQQLYQSETRRAGRLHAVAPKLCAKGAGEAVQLFLCRDAVTPAALPLPDRAARRLCDRLVDLGAVRELTGRDTFRLYGL